EPKPMFTLQISRLSRSEIQVFLGPFDKLHNRMMEAQEFKAYMDQVARGNEQSGYFLKLKDDRSPVLLSKLQRLLIRVRRAFPLDLKAVASFSDKIGYQDMIDFVSSIQVLSESNQKYSYRNLNGIIVRTNELFP